MIQRCFALPYYVYCLRLRCLVSFLFYSTIFIVGVGFQRAGQRQLRHGACSFGNSTRQNIGKCNNIARIVRFLMEKAVCKMPICRRPF
ncbi:Uncharacterised protein [Neisseria animalis]|nr:Uncharacterised protein [Neisseria animalis]